MPDKKLELLKKCAAIFEEMDGVCWNEESIWNDNSYGKVAREVYNFLNDQEKESSLPHPENEEFIVKYYSLDDHPTIKGNGFDGLIIGEDREEAQEFIDFVNRALATGQNEK